MATPPTTYNLSAKMISVLNRQNMEKLAPHRLNPVLGRAISNKLKLHLRGLNASRASKLGGKRSNFYAACGRGTSFEVEPGSITISVARIGYAQRYFGGVIRAVKKKWLTIPVDAAAYGKDPRKLPLFFAMGARGPFLAWKRKDETGPLRVAFILRKSVSQKPDPSVFLSEKVIGSTVDDTINKRLSAPQ